MSGALARSKLAVGSTQVNAGVPRFQDEIGTVRQRALQEFTSVKASISGSPLVCRCSRLILPSASLMTLPHQVPHPHFIISGKEAACNALEIWTALHIDISYDMESKPPGPDFRIAARPLFRRGAMTSLMELVTRSTRIYDNPVMCKARG